MKSGCLGLQRDLPATGSSRSAETSLHCVFCVAVDCQSQAASYCTCPFFKPVRVGFQRTSPYNNPPEFPTTFEMFWDLYQDLKASWCSYCCPCVWHILVRKGNCRVRTKVRWNRLRRNLLRRYYQSLKFSLCLFWLHRIRLTPPHLDDTLVLGISERRGPRIINC